MPFHEYLVRAMYNWVVAIRDTYLGLDMLHSPFPLLSLPVAVLGFALALRDRQHRLLHSLMALTFVGSVAVMFFLPPYHFSRHYHPYDSLFWLYISFGVVGIVRAISPSLTRNANHHSPPATRHWLLWAAVSMVLVLIPQFLFFLITTSKSARDIYYQQMTSSAWVRENTPPDTRIAANDVGAHKYLTDRYVFDLLGLTQNSMRGLYYGGWGFIFEELRALPEDERPDYLLVYNDFFITGYVESAVQGLLTQEYSVTVPGPVVSSRPTEFFYKINWDAARHDPKHTYLLHTGRNPVDHLNVGEAQGERDHAYKFEGRIPIMEEGRSIVTTAAYNAGEPSVTDSGRPHTGMEEFTVKSEPGKALVIVSRALLPGADLSLAVWANDQHVGDWKLQNDRGGFWQEYEYVIPAEFIAGNQTRITVGLKPGEDSFTSYRYWFFTP